MSAGPSGPSSTISSMLLRVTVKPRFFRSFPQITPKNCCTLFNSFCEMRLHVE